MILGRKNRKAVAEADEQPLADEAVSGDEAEASDPSPHDTSDDVADQADSDQDEDLDEEADVRADGPFDASEVDLTGDRVDRLDLGAMIVTKFKGVELHFLPDPEAPTALSVLAMYESSGLQLELFAAPTSGGLASEFREYTLQEAEQAGGNAQVLEGPLGLEIKRVLPVEGPEGEQLFNVARIWLVDGPRWLLRGTLMGPAAFVEGAGTPAEVFVEFFRNIIVQRDDSLQVPGELLTLTRTDVPNPEG